MASQEDFLQYQAPTNPHPYLLNVEKAEGLYIYTADGKRYMDMIAGVSVNNIGHRHPKVVEAIQRQTNQYLHVMVYGEFIQEALVAFSKKLASILPPSLNCVYSVNSGTEANEAALKLAKRMTGRSELIAFKGSYHGNTHGSLSVSANESKKIPFKPLLPDVCFLEHNDMAALDAITEKTAGVILETVQGDAGVRVSSPEFLQALRQRCSDVGAPLIFDEIQCGMGRTGKMFAFEHSGVVPDILTLGKALGGGLPIGALVSSYENMQLFTHDPMLGHITTFGGNPVIAASALATLNVFEQEIDFAEVERLGQLLEDLIGQNPEILAIRRIGMMFAFDMESAERVSQVVLQCLEEGLISFWFLSHPYSFRLSPPVNITEIQIREAADIILSAIAATR